MDFDDLDVPQNETQSNPALIATDGHDRMDWNKIIRRIGPDSIIKPTACQLPKIPRYNASKIIVAGIGSQRLSLDELDKPISIALDSTSNLYVLDSGNSRVLKYYVNSKHAEVVIGQAQGGNLQIWLAPTYKESIFKRVFGEPDISGSLPMGASDIYIDFNMNLFATDLKNNRVRKVSKDEQGGETIFKTKVPTFGIFGDCYGNLYALDTESSLRIYNAFGEEISIMQNAIDNPYNSDEWERIYMGFKPAYDALENFGSLAVDQKNGDL
ncbi:unnamed protein product, partial [Rotaria sp. Silwood1]